MLLNKDKKYNYGNKYQHRDDTSLLERLASLHRIRFTIEYSPRRIIFKKYGKTVTCIRDFNTLGMFRISGHVVGIDENYHTATGTIYRVRDLVNRKKI